jgi:thioredoxin-related protein
MSDALVRLAVLILVSLLLFLLVWSGRRYVEIQRRAALATISLEGLPIATLADHTSTAQLSSHVYILAFSSADCQQCHTLQAPALQRIIEARGADVSVVEIDAPGSPQLTQRYHVLTLPTTVVLDVTGKAHAVNYGFANAQRLLVQVNEVLAPVVQRA